MLWSFARDTTPVALIGMAHVRSERDSALVVAHFPRASTSAGQQELIGPIALRQAPCDGSIRRFGFVVRLRDTAAHQQQAACDCTQQEIGF